MTSQVRNLWCRSQNKMGPSSKYVSSQPIFFFFFEIFIYPGISIGRAGFLC